MQVNYPPHNFATQEQPLSQHAVDKNETQLLDEAAKSEEEFQEVLSDYLNTVTMASNNRSKASRMGLPIIATAITGIAYLALQNNKMTQFNLKLQNEITAFNATLKEQQETIDALHQTLAVEQAAINRLKATLSNCLKRVPQLPSLNAITAAFREFVCGAPDCPTYAQDLQNVANECFDVPYFDHSSNETIGIQQRCLTEEHVKEFATLTFTLNPKNLKPSNLSSALYNRGALICQTQNFPQSANITQSFCSGHFNLHRKYVWPMKGQPFFDTSNQKTITFLNSSVNLEQVKEFMHQGVGQLNA